jgi:hypothetical protein
MASNQHTFRVRPNDEKVLYALAEYLDRSIADTVRFSIRKVARESGLLPARNIPTGDTLGKRKEVRDAPSA